MKNRKIQFIILAFLAIPTLYFFFNNSQGTLKKKRNNFTVNDTSLIDRIYLIGQNENTIILERTTVNWKVNKNSFACPEMVTMLLKTLVDMQIKEPVAKSIRDKIINELTVNSTKVEIYQKGKLSKILLVGGPTQDSSGTYMMVEKSMSPFVVEIPGFSGFLTPRFSVQEFKWKATIAFDIPINDISEVTVENNLQKNASFKIRQKRNSIELVTWPDNKPIEQFNESKLQKYLLEFRNKRFKKYIEKASPELMDSIKTNIPEFTISVITQLGETTQIKAYSKSGKGKFDFFGNPLAVDPDFFYILINNHDLGYASYFAFDPLFVDIKSFRKE